MVNINKTIQRDRLYNFTRQIEVTTPRLASSRGDNDKG